MTPATTSEDLARQSEVALALQAFERSDGPTIKRVRYTHDAMIDLIIENPWVAQGELAKHFGYTEGWVSIIINSDAFQARLEARKDQLIDPAIRLSLNERFNAVVARSLTVLQEKLSRPVGEIPDNLVLRAVEIGAKALGTGGHAPPAAPVDHLASLAERLLALNGKSRNPPSGVLVYDERSSQNRAEDAVLVPAAQSPLDRGEAHAEAAHEVVPYHAGQAVCDGQDQPGG